MAKATSIIVLLKNNLPGLKRKYPVSRMALFGSYARKKIKKSSDIDLAVELSEDIGLFKFLSLKFELENLTGRKVDLIEFRAMKPELKKYILPDLIPVE